MPDGSKTGARSDAPEPLWKEAYDAAALGARYDELASLAGTAEQRFDRGFRTRLYNLPDGDFLSLTELDDDFHSMRVALRIDAGGTVSEAAGRMLNHPYDTCPRAIEALRNLAGANLNRPSSHRQIKERVPRTEGCLHIVDMVEVAFRAFRISKGHDIPTGYGGEQTRRGLLRLLPSIRDTCVSFAIERDPEP